MSHIISAAVRGHPCGTAPRRALTRASVVLSVTTLALLGWMLASWAAGVDLSVSGGDSGASRLVGPVSVLAVAFLSGVAGWALLAALERLTDPRIGRRWWTCVAVLVLTVSLLGPLSAASAAAVVALACLHLIVGTVLIFGLVRSAEGGQMQHQERG